MTAATYNDDVALRAYVLRHFPQLMTPLERRVTEYIAPIISNTDDSKILRLHEFLQERDGHVDDADVISAFQKPYDDRIANAVDRILETRRDDFFENRCAQCQRLARTPAAKQCLWCGHDWHQTTPQTGNEDGGEPNDATERRSRAF
ncbi:hypothetical protein LOC71_04970 [Rhodopirellula sp. JC740]|uniref:Uncharacterized protein n=1 Tax=Rhodopirellula halodulae TaxID=2894198 RepID=A0ABS8NDH7_9BACT|nr:hypothetical protein [Rhodopirellula sp. JC740]MCC9641616.1 hypothetical protein [Rhodopirellula sp. JC740]